ncbi:MAG: MATE family efflux transporter [Clostridiales bacterium]|nr:MATE family efflux transporter [Clostridiales bacterium]
MEIDMTTGKPAPKLWAFSLPLLFSVMFQQLYSIIDSVVAGKFAGKDALAAVGASYPVTMLFLAFATGANIGCSVIVSQYFGAKKYQSMKTGIYTSLISISVLSVVLTVIGSICCDGLIGMLGTPESIFSDSSLYLRIYIWGLFFLFLYNIATGIFTAMGDSRTPLYFLIASSIANIILDYVFVAVCKMGVAGVAWATFLCQGVAAVCSVAALLLRIPQFKEKSQKKQNLFSWQMLKKISLVAIPSILQQSFISIGNLFIQWEVNSYDTNVIAAYTSAVKLNTFVITSLTTLANGLSNYTAQNMGAKKPERIPLGFRVALIMVLMVCIPIVFLYCAFGSSVIGIFLDKEEQVAAVIKEGVLFLRIVSPFYFVIALKLMADGVLRGSGAMRYFMISTFTDLILRVILSYLFSVVCGLGSVGIWFSWPVGWSAGAALSLWFYKGGHWKEMYLAA